MCLSFVRLLGRRFYVLNESKKYTVGRHARCDLFIADDASISPKHAIIYRSSSGVRVEDVGSKYGIYVNDGIKKNKPIEEKTLVDLQVGHIVRFGRLQNTFRLENMNVKVCTSTLLQDHVRNLQRGLKVIDGVLTERLTEEACGRSNKPSARKLSSLSSDQFMSPPPAPKQQPQASTSKQPPKLKHAEQANPPKSVGNETMEQGETGGSLKKPKKNDNDSGENISSSAPIANVLLRNKMVHILTKTFLIDTTVNHDKKVFLSELERYFPNTFTHLHIVL